MSTALSTELWGARCDACGLWHGTVAMFVKGHWCKEGQLGQGLNPATTRGHGEGQTVVRGVCVWNTRNKKVTTVPSRHH